MRVRAHDGVKYGSWRDQENVITTKINHKPGQPGTLSSSSVTETSATVNWGAASDSDGDRLTYHVEYKKDHSWTWTSAGSTTSRSKTISGLSEGTAYDVRVRAHDGGKYGSWRDQENVITTKINHKPGQPGTLSSSSVTETSATVLFLLAIGSDRRRLSSRHKY